MSDRGKTNLTTINPSGDADKRRAILEKAMRELPMEVEFAGLMAKIRRERFRAYLREGFTEAQALELVKAEIR